jgi:hypothetical protein
MARVKSIGALATVNRMMELRDSDAVLPDLEPGAVQPFNVHVRLFAKLNDGLLAMDPRPQTMGVGVVPSEFGDLAQLIQSQMQMAGQLPAEHRDAWWGRVIAVLAEVHKVHIDATTLMALDFELVPDGELRAVLAGG